MSKELKENTFFIFMGLIRDLILSLIQSVGLLIKSLFQKNPKKLKENKLLDVMNFFFHIGPKSFWKAPSGIKIGRSLATFLHYIFKKEQAFVEKNNN